MASDDDRRDRALVVQETFQSREVTPPLGFWQRINAENLARIERSLAVAEQARLIRHQATDERLFQEATWRRRWERRAQLEEQAYQIQSLRYLEETEQLELSREVNGHLRTRAELQSQIEERRLSNELEALEDNDEGGLTLEEAEQQLTVLKSYIEGLKADKQLLLEAEETGQGGSWQAVQTLSENIAQFEKMHRELHGQYTKHILGIA